MITLTVYSTEYEPWEEGSDDRKLGRSWQDVHTFDTARECADWLDRNGLNSPSHDPGPYNIHTWLSDLDPYTHPYTGVLTEQSAHVSSDTKCETSARLWAAIVATVSRPWTRYRGPYYVERVSA